MLTKKEKVTKRKKLLLLLSVTFYFGATRIEVRRQKSGDRSQETGVRSQESEEKLLREGTNAVRKLRVTSWIFFTAAFAKIAKPHLWKLPAGGRFVF